MRENLLAHKEQVYLSRELAVIRTDVDFPCTIEECRLGWEREKLLPVLEELEFDSIIRTVVQGEIGA